MLISMNLLLTEHHLEELMKDKVHIRIILVSLDHFTSLNKTDGSIQRNRFILDVMEVFILLQYSLVRKSIVFKCFFKQTFDKINFRGCKYGI